MIYGEALWGGNIAFGMERKMSDKSSRESRTNRASAIHAVSPALEHYTNDVVLNGLWVRPELSGRDRGLITCAALIARLQTVDMPFYFALALDKGVEASELSELITHLAFYSGWPNATAAALVASELFRARGVSKKDLPQAKAKLLPIDEDAESKRAAMVSGSLGGTTPGLVQNTTDLLFRDLWLRPALAPRDRSLATVTALIASGQIAQIPYHPNKAMDTGLTATEAGEIVTHVAFYAGWPTCFDAAPVFKDVIEKRPA